MTTILSFDRRAQATVPAVGIPARQLRTYTDLLADSLRSACRKDGDVMFSLFARVLDQHLVQTTHQPFPVAQSQMNTALDEILMMISIELHQEMASGAARGRTGLKQGG